MIALSLLAMYFVPFMGFILLGTYNEARNFKWEFPPFVEGCSGVCGGREGHVLMAFLWPLYLPFAITGYAVYYLFKGLGKLLRPIMIYDWLVGRFEIKPEKPNRNDLPVVDPVRSSYRNVSFK